MLGTWGSKDSLVLAQMELSSCPDLHPCSREIWAEDRALSLDVRRSHGMGARRQFCGPYRGPCTQLSYPDSMQL